MSELRSSRWVAIGVAGFFLAAAAATVNIAVAETSSGAAARVSQREPAYYRAVLASDSRNSALWISLGLAAEGAGDLDGAARAFRNAENLDRQYAPAWTAANFYFRHHEPANFWVSAARASAMSYDDLAPLIDLADHMDQDPDAALSRLGSSRRLERAYLDYLVARERWDQAHAIAERLMARRESADAPQLGDLVDRLIAAGRGQEAVDFCRKLPDCRAPETVRTPLTNGDFRLAPQGHGFDWRVLGPAAIRWKEGWIEFTLPGDEHDAYPLLEQPVLLDARNYRLRFEYRMPAPGLRWVAQTVGRSEETLSPPYEAAPVWRRAEWRMPAQRGGLIRLRLMYRREPGSVAASGEAALRNLNMEIQ